MDQKHNIANWRGQNSFFYVSPHPVVPATYNTSKFYLQYQRVKVHWSTHFSKVCQPIARWHGQLPNLQGCTIFLKGFNIDFTITIETCSTKKPQNSCAHTCTHTHTHTTHPQHQAISEIGRESQASDKLNASQKC